MLKQAKKSNAKIISTIFFYIELLLHSKTRNKLNFKKILILNCWEQFDYYVVLFIDLQ